MRHGVRRAGAVVVALLLVWSLAGCGEKSASDRLPDVTLAPLRTTDSSVALRDLRGPMVVNLWAQWCGPCRDELPFYQQFHAKHPGVKVLGVDWLDPRREKAVALAAKVGLTYPLVVDPDKAIATRGLPLLVLVDDRGRIAYRANLEIKSLAQLEALVTRHLGVSL